MNLRRLEISWRTFVFASMGAICAFGVVLIATDVRAGNSPTQQQDVLRLESRITQLEQRLYTLENSIRTIEQQSRMGSARGGVSPDDLNLIRAQLQAFERRLGDDECGIAKLDERTLSPQRREARKRSGGADPEQCRQNVDAPLRLP
jgi:hypothetical protein